MERGGGALVRSVVEGEGVREEDMESEVVTFGMRGIDSTGEEHKARRKRF